MQIAVFDTYVHRPDGRRMHFDILVPNAGREHASVLAHGRKYLAQKGVPSESLVATECSFCHIEQASSSVQSDIEANGYSILEMQHCD
jgi:Domain of unknown function (DUF2024)